MIHPMTNPSDERAARAAHAFLAREASRRERDRLLTRIILYTLLFLFGVVMAVPPLAAELWHALQCVGGVGTC